MTSTQTINSVEIPSSDPKKLVRETVITTKYGNRNYMHLTPEVGYCFYVNRYLSIEPSVYCNLCFNRFSEGTEVGLKLGMGFYF